MEKIVILTDDSEGDSALIARLRVLFPECELQVASIDKESAGPIPRAPNPSPAGKEEKGKRNNVNRK
jgi:hypothetical protein